MMQQHQLIFNVRVDWLESSEGTSESVSSTENKNCMKQTLE